MEASTASEEISCGDSQLIQRAQSGDGEALSVLYRRYVKDVYQFIYLRTGTQMDAEDLTADTFYKMIHGLRSYRGEGEFLSWLLGIARYVVYDFWRTRYRAHEISLDQFLEWLPNEMSPPLFDSQVKKLFLKRLLDALPENYRQVLELRFLENSSTSEISQQMGISENYVKVLQHRALKKALQLAKSMTVKVNDEHKE